MEFLDSIIDILFVIGAIALGFFPGIKKMLGEVKEPKKVVRPIIQESDEEPKRQSKRREKSVPKVAQEQTSDKEEYFSYETMSDREFENLFTQSEEESVEHVMVETLHNDIHLTMDEEEVYKGVVWSEILRRKYK